MADVNLLFVPGRGEPDGLAPRGRATAASAEGELFLQRADAHSEGVVAQHEASNAARDGEPLALAAEDTGGANSKKQEDITELPMFLVLLILSPDYFVIFAYLLLVWQLHSFHNDGYASSLARILFRDSCKCNIILISFILFAIQCCFTILYILDIMSVINLINFLTTIDFFIPCLLSCWVLYLKCKFSGVPCKEEYKKRLSKLNYAIVVWTVGRFLRAVSSLWDTKALMEMMLELRFRQQRSGTPENADATKDSNSDRQGLIVPMLLIVCYVIVEIIPIWTVLDGNFVDIFLKFDVLVKDLIAPLLLQDGSLLQNIDNPQTAQDLLQQHDQLRLEQALAAENSFYEQQLLHQTGIHGVYSQAPSLSFASSTRQSELLFGQDISTYDHGVNLLPGLGATTRSKTSIKSLQNRPLDHLRINQSLQQGSTRGNNWPDSRIDETDDNFFAAHGDLRKPNEGRIGAPTNLSDQNQLQSRA